MDGGLISELLLSFCSVRSACAARHLAADLLAIAARLDAFLHDVVLMPLARRRTIPAGVGARGVSVFRHRAAAGRQGGGQRAERLAVHHRFVRRDMIIGVRPTLFQLAEAVMGRLVAELCTVADRLDVPVMLVSLIIGTG